MTDVVVVGGGIVGRAVAWRLHRTFGSARIRLLERRHHDRGASFCAAGLTGPQSTAILDETRRAAPSLGPPDRGGALRRLDFYTRCHLRTAELGLELAEHGAGAATPRWTGVLLVSSDDIVARRWADAGLEQRARGLSAEVVTPLNLMEIEPALASTLAGGAYLPEDTAWLPGDLMDALEQALTSAGVPIERDTEARDLTLDRDRVTGVHTSHGAIAADAVVLCTGAWAEPWLPLAGIHVPLKAERGQILEVGGASPSLRNVVTSGDTLLVPHARGMLIGSTYERGVAEESVTIGGIAALAERARALLPGVEARPLVAARAGVRACTPDGYPIAGQAPALRNLFVATGHGDRGVLTAALSADLVAWAIERREVPAWATCTSPSRA